MTRLALVIVAACGARPAGTWVEHEAAQTHETASRGVPRGGGNVAIDPARLDDYDEVALVAGLARIGDAAPAARIALRLARLAHHRGDDADARALVGRAANAADEPAVHAQLAALAAEVAAPRVDPAVVAVLLPLSGRYSAIGIELRAAIELAPAAGTKWAFVDTKGEPDGASAAVDTAVAKGAIAILGPVGEREARAAARRASLRGIPIGLLAPGDGADPSAGVFRLVWSTADEARAVAQLAVTDNFPTVAVLAPRDDVGAEAADAFVAEAKRLGLQVTGQGSYDPTGGDLEPEVKQFLGLVPAQNPRLAEHIAKHGKKGWSTFSPDVPFTLLYVPDRYDRAALVAAFLPFFNVELRTVDFPDPAKLARKHGGHLPQVVQLVGGGGWHHPSLPIRGGSAVQGALIVDVYGGDTVGGDAATFASQFQQRLSHAPTAAAAQAYDAAALVAAARKEAASAASGGCAPTRSNAERCAGSIDPQVAMKRALATAKLDDGACGPASVGADGELARTASVLEVSGNELIVAP